jgi:hypothetical protein
MDKLPPSRSSAQPRLASERHDIVREEPGAPKTPAYRVLSLAAAPTFAVMALVGAIQDGGMASMLCSAAHGASPLTGPLTGMVPMYLLMSAFHLKPWLRLVASRRGGARHAPGRSLSALNLSVDRSTP